MELRHNNTERLTVRRPKASLIAKSTVRVGGWGSHDAGRLFFESTVVRFGIPTTARLSSPRHLSPAEPSQIHQKEVEPCESRNPLDSSPLQCWHWAFSALPAAAVIARLLSRHHHHLHLP